MLKLICILLCSIQVITAHQVWAYMNTDESIVLFNRYNWASTEQVCNNTMQGITDTRVCFTGAPGRKCIGMYMTPGCPLSDEKNPSSTYHEFSAYCTGTNPICSEIGFTGNDYSTILDIELGVTLGIAGIELAFAKANMHTTGTTFVAYGVKTWDC